MYIIFFYYPLHARTHGKLSENVDTWEPAVNRWVALYGNYQWSSAQVVTTLITHNWVFDLCCGRGGKRLSDLITNGGETSDGSGNRKSVFSTSRRHRSKRSGSRQLVLLFLRISVCRVFIAWTWREFYCFSGSCWSKFKVKDWQGEAVRRGRS